MLLFLLAGGGGHFCYCCMLYVFFSTDWLYLQLFDVGMSSGSVSLGSVPSTFVVCVSSEDGSLTAEFVLVISWEWNGIMVLVDNERWASNVLHIALDILVRKHLGGSEVIFVGYEMAVVVAASDWIERFGSSPYELWYDERVDEDDVERKKVVTFNMFALAVRRGVISEEDLL